MPRKPNPVPSYLFHKPRNCGKIRLDGIDYYLPGKYESAGSREAYSQAVAEWLRTGRPPGWRSTETTVDELLWGFVKQVVQVRYVKHGEPTSEQRSYATALRPVRQLYGGDPVSAFTPRALVSCRQVLIDAGYTRKRINGHVGRIRRAFKWGVAQGFVAETTWRALGAIEGLRFGEAKESNPVLPADETGIAFVQPFVTPPIWAMVQVQLWSACRPGEACSMRTQDILSGDPHLPAVVRNLCHVYYPHTHKGEHHGRRRMILLGPQAMAVIDPWLRPDEPAAYLFSPEEARQWYHAKRREEARAPRRHFSRKEHPKRKPGKRYRLDSYSNAIRTACQRAGIEHWHPHQLRHNAATRLRAKYGIEVARIILGHASTVTTELYAEIDLERAVRAIAESG